LTVLFLAVIVGAWLAIRTQSKVTQQADAARYWLTRVSWVGAALLVAIAVVPVGKRANVEGNVPKLVGMSAAEAAEELDDAALYASFQEDPLVDERCRVVEQRPRPGTTVAEVVTVSLRCAIRVPRVVGRKAVLAR
jgi:beta-lactam-binding protein with PASTA domain